MEVAVYDAHHAVDLLNRAILRHKHQAWAETGYPSPICKTPAAELVARQELNGWGMAPSGTQTRHQKAVETRSAGKLGENTSPQRQRGSATP